MQNNESGAIESAPTTEESGAKNEVRVPETVGQFMHDGSVTIFDEEQFLEAWIESDTSYERKAMADGGRRIVPIPADDVGQIREYDGTAPCEYGCNGESEYRVPVQVATAEAVVFACRSCLRDAGIYPEEGPDSACDELVTDGSGAEYRTIFEESHGFKSECVQCGARARSIPAVDHESECPASEPDSDSELVPDGGTDSEVRKMSVERDSSGEPTAIGVKVEYETPAYSESANVGFSMEGSTASLGWVSIGENNDRFHGPGLLSAIDAAHTAVSDLPFVEAIVGPDSSEGEREIMTDGGRVSRNPSRKAYWSENDREATECAVCGSETDDLHVHHKDGQPRNNDLSNLTAVCKNCHVAAHRRAEMLNRLNRMADEATDVFGLETDRPHTEGVKISSTFSGFMSEGPGQIRTDGGQTNLAAWHENQTSLDELADELAETYGDAEHECEFVDFDDDLPPICEECGAEKGGEKA